MGKGSRIRSKSGYASKAGASVKKQAADKNTFKTKIIAGLGALALITIGCLFVAFSDSLEDFFLVKYEAFKDMPEKLREKAGGKLSMDEDGFYEIRTASDYRIFWKMAIMDSDVKGKMMNDICLNNTDGWDNWHKNPPKNVSEPVKYFSGVFDGNGHTLYGLYSDSRLGLVRMNAGSILNLTIKESLVTGDFSNGGICYYNDSLISGCKFRGKGWTPQSGKRAGICIENSGTIERCGFTGTMGNAWSRSDKAGICIKNRGTVTECYNLSVRSSGLSGTCYGITNKGETKCYIKEGAGWDIAPESQVTELSNEQVFYLADLLDGDLYSVFSNSGSKPVWMRQIQRMQTDLSLEENNREDFPQMGGTNQSFYSLTSHENESEKARDLREELLSEAALKAAFEDKMTAFLISSLAGQENMQFSRLDLTPSAKGEKGSLFQIEITYDDAALKVTAFPVQGPDRDCRSLWQTGGEILGAGEGEWEHRTYKLTAGSFWEAEEDLLKKHLQEGKLGKEAVLMLYQTAGGREGFFYITKDTVYQMEAGGKENDDLYEKAFGQLCVGRKLEDGILWTDKTLRQEILREAEHVYGKEAGKLSAEEIMELTSLTIDHVQEIKSFQDLEYFPHLTSLSISGGGPEEGEKEVKIRLPKGALPVLQSLSIQNCRLGETAFLEQMQDLRELYLEDCVLETDTAFLGKMSRLEVLEIGNMEMTDISFLESMPGLKRLSLEGNSLTEITSIASCRNLEELSLSDNGVEDISPLAGLTKLRNLDLSYNNITDINGAGVFSRLKNLNLGYNQISDISVLNELKELTWLRIDGNKVMDLSPVQGRDGLAIRYTIAYY